MYFLFKLSAREGAECPLIQFQSLTQVTLQPCAFHHLGDFIQCSCEVTQISADATPMTYQYHRTSDFTDVNGDEPNDITGVDGVLFIGACERWTWSWRFLTDFQNDQIVMFYNLLLTTLHTTVRCTRTSACRFCSLEHINFAGIPDCSPPNAPCLLTITELLTSLWLHRCGMRLIHIPMSDQWHHSCVDSWLTNMTVDFN